MFKISLLNGIPEEQHQPAIQPSGVSQNSRCSKGAAGSTTSTTSTHGYNNDKPFTDRPQQQLKQHVDAASGLSALLQPRDWSVQAADVTSNLLDASKYKSMALYAEVKLAEALDKAARACPDAADQDGQLLPNQLKTAVCCQLLGELSGLCGPFSKTLLKIRDLLIPAVYSSYAAAKALVPLQFDQLPWFAVAAQLRGANKMLMAQQECFKQELSRHQVQMMAVEQQLLAFKVAIDDGQAAGAVLQCANEALVAAREQAEQDAAVAGEESKRLAAEVARLKEELGEVQEQLSNARDGAAQDSEQWERQLAAIKKQLYVEVQEREAAVALAAARLTPAEGQELERRCLEAERRMQEAEERLSEAAAASIMWEKQQREQQEQLTPRPLDWGTAQQLADQCQSTSETVHQVLQQHADRLTCLQQHNRILTALLEAEPAPQPWQLSLRADSSNYFITEGGGFDSDKGAQPQLCAEPLGLDGKVPRFLRWDEAVPLQEVGSKELQQQIKEIWQHKALHVARHGPCHLQNFLHHYFSASVLQGQQRQQRQQALASQAAAAEQAMDSVANAAAAAAAGYSFYRACCQHRQDSSVVELTWQVLTGQLPEEAMQMQQQQLQQLLQVMQALQAAAAAAGGGVVFQCGVSAGDCLGEVCLADCRQALRLLYPHKPDQHLEELLAHLAELAMGPTFTADRIGRSTSSLTPGNLRVLVAALQEAAGVAVASRKDHYPAAAVGAVDAAGAEGVALLHDRTQAGQAAAEALVECVLRQHLQAEVAWSKHWQQEIAEQMASSAQTAAGGDGSSCSAASFARGMTAVIAASSMMQPPSGHLSAAEACTGLRAVSSQQQRVSLCPDNDQQPSSSGAGNGKDLMYGAPSARPETAEAELEQSAVNDVCLVTVSAAAGSAAAVQRGSPRQKDHLSSADIITAGVIRSTLARWQGAAEQACGALGGDYCPPQQPELTPQELLAWLRRDCFLPPAESTTSAEAACRWCHQCIRPPSQGSGEPESTVRGLNERVQG